MNYQKTLNLPKTSFSMKANLTHKEPEALKRWLDEGMYDSIRQKSKGKKTFTLHDGPPYANGNIHIGHALNKILKDFVVKMKTMQDMDSLYVPGWDCHGLPIEHQLFKELKKRKSDVDTVQFRKQAHDYAMKYVAIQREQFKRLGVFGEWDQPYLTLNPEYEYWILKSFAKLTQDGYIYRGLKPVNWCATCETALAEAEVEYENHTSPSIFVKFPVQNPQVIDGLPQDKPVYLLIWTTTPWTLLANVAVCAHPAFEYVFVDVGEEILIVEKSLQENVFAKSGLTIKKIIKEVTGRGLKDLLYTHPFGLMDNCRVINMEYVTREEGSGLVHIAPGHGQEDFEAGQLYGLDILMPVNDRGVFKEEAKAFAGQHVFKANANIIEDLKLRKLLAASQDLTHSYPHCWRCKKPVIFRATKQWFMKIDQNGLRARLKNIVQTNVEWFPAAGRERISAMIVSRPDWCLSRQRHWGVPIPALKCVGTDGEYRLYPQVIEHFAEVVKKEGTNAWFEKDLKDLIPEKFKCPETGCKDFEKTFDILDVWFDSGVSHKAVIEPMMAIKTPVELYLEGSDQHRGWFQSSLIPAVAMENQAPFKAVLTHGFVVDGDGRKMSKSLGNVISPLDLIKNHGADILRLWVASSNTNEDIRISKEIFDRLIDAYRKIRNTFRFILGNLNEFNPDEHILPYGKLLMIDQWALAKSAETFEAVQDAYNRYDFSQVYKLIYSFCNETLSGFYLDILKDRLYTFSSLSETRRSAQTVLYYICDHLVRLCGPLLCFTADEIFSLMPKTKELTRIKSVHLLNWLEVPPQWEQVKDESEITVIMAMRPFVMKALEEKRRVAEIGASLEAKVVFRSASQKDLKALKALEVMLPELFVVSQVEVKEEEKVERGLGEEFSKTQIEIVKAEGQKCPRCWNFRILGEDSDHPEICSRCSLAVKDMGYQKALSE